MNHRMLGIIDATTYTSAIEDLTVNRSMAAIPFAGRYRLIDFVLSNMVNSDIESVAIFPKYQYRSLMDHLGSGKQWDLNRKRDGLFFFPSPHLNDQYNEFGSIRQLSDHIDYFLRSNQEYAVITNSYTVCNIDFRDVLAQHVKMGCDITEIRKDGQPLHMYLMSTKLLLNLIYDNNQTGFKTIAQVIMDNTHKMKICDYAFEGYVAIIDSIDSYYRHSLEMLKPEVWQQLFIQSRPILTKVKDEPPARHGQNAIVKNSMIANGSVIEGRVENSIIFRAVHIGKGTVIKNSIIMQKSQVGENCLLENVVLDKDVKVGTGIELKGSAELPIVLRKGTVQGALMSS